MADSDPELLHATARDGARVAADVVGSSRSGETLLFLSGLGYGPWSWGPQRADLASEYRIVLMHNRGTGRSDAPPGPYSIDMMADDAAEVLRALDSDPAHVVGASMGGYIALRLAQAYPDLVASVVVIASSPGGPGAVPVPQETSQLWRDHAHLPADEFARRTMPHSLAPGWTQAHPSEYTELLEARLTCPTTPEAWQAQSAACEMFLARGLAGDGPHQPVVAIHGTADRVVPLENLAVLGRRIPQAHLVTLEGAGHLCWLERPDDVNRLIRGHLAEIGAAP